MGHEQNIEISVITLGLLSRLILLFSGWFIFACRDTSTPHLSCQKPTLWCSSRKKEPLELRMLAGGISAFCKYLHCIPPSQGSTSSGSLKALQHAFDGMTNGVVWLGFVSSFP